jgi:hypothetical protein
MGVAVRLRLLAVVGGVGTVAPRGFRLGAIIYHPAVIDPTND